MILMRSLSYEIKVAGVFVYERDSTSGKIGRPLWLDDDDDKFNSYLLIESNAPALTSVYFNQMNISLSVIFSQDGQSLCPQVNMHDQWFFFAE